MKLTVEEALRQAADRVAFVRWALASHPADAAPEPEALSGCYDVCEDTEELLRSVRKGLDVDALCIELQTEASRMTLKRVKKNGW
jgi:hypothetical protein